MPASIPGVGLSKKRGLQILVTDGWRRAGFQNRKNVNALERLLHVVL